LTVGGSVEGGRDELVEFCPRGKPETMVSMSFVLKQLDERGGGTNQVLVDACRNDPSPGRGRGIDGNRVEALPEGTAVLFSCSKGQRAFESAKAGGGHGVFSHFVLEELRVQAKNDRGAVTWDRLVTYVKEQVEEELPKLVGDAPARQVPHEVRNLGLTPVLLDRMIASAGAATATVDVRGRVKMEFVLIQPGKFLMGSPKGEKDRKEDEEQHEVGITGACYLGKYVVTQEEYEAVTGKNPSYYSAAGGGKDRVKGLDTRRFPVENMSWEDAVAHG
jgi:hypothetical protein